MVMQKQEKAKIDVAKEAMKRLFGQILKGKGLLTEDQIQEALAIQNRYAQTKDRRIAPAIWPVPRSWLAG